MKIGLTITQRKVRSITRLNAYEHVTSVAVLKLSMVRFHIGPQLQAVVILVFVILDGMKHTGLF